jgi:hypothetical protein
LTRPGNFGQNSTSIWQPFLAEFCDGGAQRGSARFLFFVSQRLVPQTELASKAGEVFPETTEGVRQGCPLSPLLFGQYIDELESLPSEQEGCDFVTVGMLILFCLLYADDALLSRSTEGHQAQLDTAVCFGRDKGLQLNSDKSKIFTLGKPSSHDKGRRWKLWTSSSTWAPTWRILESYKKTLERRFQDETREQLDAAMIRLRFVLSLMAQRPFMIFLRLFITTRNVRDSSYSTMSLSATVGLITRCDWHACETWLDHCLLHCSCGQVIKRPVPYIEQKFVHRTLLSSIKSVHHVVNTLEIFNTIPGALNLSSDMLNEYSFK